MMAAHALGGAVADCADSLVAAFVFGAGMSVLAVAMLEWFGWVCGAKLQ